jgi:chemotaxis protein CheD
MRRRLPTDIYLLPGQFCCGVEGVRVRTLLGSCVAMSFWHPLRRVGAMCHFLLPARIVEGGGAPDGRYGDEAVAAVLAWIAAAGCLPSEFEVKLVGGGNMFPASAGQAPVGDRNLQAAQELARLHGFSCVASHLGGAGHREVVFDVRTGEVAVWHHALPASASTSGGARALPADPGDGRRATSG